MHGSLHGCFGIALLATLFPQFLRSMVNFFIEFFCCVLHGISSAYYVLHCIFCTAFSSWCFVCWFGFFHILWTAFSLVVFHLTFPTARAPRPLSQPVHPPGRAAGGGGQSLAAGESLLLSGVGAKESYSEQGAALGSLPGLRGRGAAPPAAPRRR